VEASVGDGGAAGEVEVLKAGGGVGGQVRHAPVLYVFAVGEGDAFEVGGADDGARGRGGWVWLLLLVLGLGLGGVGVAGREGGSFGSATAFVARVVRHVHV
jgi:hypothetical protein